MSRLVPWHTVAPLVHSGQIDAPVRPFRLGCGVRLGRVPRRFLSSEFRNGIDEQLGRRWRAGPAQFCLVTTYKAHSYGDPSGAPAGGPPTKQDAARQRLQLAALSLWLARPSSVHFRFVAHVHESHLGGVKLPPLFFTFDEKPSLSRYAAARLTPADLKGARRLNVALNALNLSGPVFIAARYLWLALNQEHADVRLGILWMAVDALFGPEDGQGIGEAIRKRVPAFFGGSRKTQIENHGHAAAGWKARCEVMHGDTLGARSRKEKEYLLLESESIVRGALLSVLLDWRRRRAFETSTGRDAYLTRIACAFVRPGNAESELARRAREKEVASI